MSRFILFLVAFCYAAAVQGTDAKPANVSYQSVLDLSVGVPDYRLAYGDDPRQFGELWLPKNSAKPYPLLIMIHGGCWLNQYDIRHTHAFSTALRDAGFAVWSLEYRRTGDPGGGWPGTYRDIVRGIEAVRMLADYDVGYEQAILLGHSAGGHLALLAGSRPEFATRFQAVVGLAAIVDVEAYARGDNPCQQAAVRFFGGSYDTRKAEYDAANPQRQSLHPATFLFHGEVDSIVPPIQATKSQVKYELINGAGHFDMIHPQTAAFHHILRKLEALSKP